MHMLACKFMYEIWIFQFSYTPYIHTYIHTYIHMYVWSHMHMFVCKCTYEIWHHTWMYTQTLCMHMYIWTEHITRIRMSKRSEQLTSDMLLLPHMPSRPAAHIHYLCAHLHTNIHTHAEMTCRQSRESFDLENKDEVQYSIVTLYSSAHTHTHTYTHSRAKKTCRQSWMLWS